MPNSKLIQLHYFYNITDAAIMKSRLATHNIEAVIFDENISSVYPMFGQTLGGIRLMVKESDFEKAKLILNIK